PGAALPLAPGPAGGAPWALAVAAPDDESDLPPALEAVAAGVRAGTALVAVAGGTPLTRRLLCEAARLDHGALSLLVEDADDDVATTAVLSGRTDLVAARPGELRP
ncbi:hypothetical protein, partial [Geodermatophilus sp. CPCC 205761]